MIQILNIQIPQFIIKETTEETSIEHIIGKDIESANKHFDMLLNNRPKDVYYNLKLIDVNKGIPIREYDSITDNT